METLDKLCYDLCDVNETIEQLYARIFPKLNLVTAKKPSSKSKKSLQDSGSGASGVGSNESTSTTGTGSSGATDSLFETTTTTTTGASANGASSSATAGSGVASGESSDEFDDEMKRPLSDREIIFLLCDWAITTRRSGLHRIFYAVFLIKKRQIDLITQVKEANRQIRNVINFKTN